jgi:topoisomerase-4 subunit A
MAGSTRSAATSCRAAAASASRCGCRSTSDAEVEIAPCWWSSRAPLLVASSDGRGFVTSGEAVLAETRKGKQLVNLRPGAKLRCCGPVPAEGADAVAVIGENRKLLVFPLAELPEMGAGGRAAAALSRRRACRRDAQGWRRPQLEHGRRQRRTRTEADLTPGARSAARAGGWRRSASRAATASRMIDCSLNR